MSIECSECERDLRGGHDPSCSRYKKMICSCGHLSEAHDEEGCCWECDCVNFDAKDETCNIL